MFRIVFVIIIFSILGLGLFFYFRSPSKTDLASPFIQNLGKVLGFSKSIPSPKEATDNLINRTKNSAQENAQKSIETVKSNVYNEAKTALDSVFNKQDNNKQANNPGVNVTVLGISSSDNTKPSYIIDLSKDSSLNLNLSVNQKYYLKFQNIPTNYCIYINDKKYPLNDGLIAVEFTQGGNFPIKANSCDLNDKNLGTLTVH